MSASDEQYKKKLIERYVAGEATEMELQAFFGLITEAEIDNLIEDHMDHEILRLRDEQHLLTPVKRFKIWKYAAVISGFLLVSYGGYYIFHNKNQTQQIAQNHQQDLVPGKNQATLTLANGQKIVLTKSLNGKLAQQGNTSIQINPATGITYNGKDNTNTQYNTLTTARGEIAPLPLILSDGTKVWLNTASSITYPVTFAANERKVTITGEALFEVEHNALHPFIVISGSQTTEDIGTSFDVNAYTDETVLKTTLIEGKVKISNNENSIFLKPGQQSQLIASKFTVNDANVDETIAWKNGMFRFTNEKLSEIMLQASRWYNVDVVYANEALKNKTYGVIGNRFAKASELLHTLELTGELKFKIEGKKITVYDK